MFVLTYDLDGEFKSLFTPTFYSVSNAHGLFDCMEIVFSETDLVFFFSIM